MTRPRDERRSMPTTPRPIDAERHEREAELAAGRIDRSTLAGARQRVTGTSGAGLPLAAAMLPGLERQLGHRFADVRIHADSEAGRAAETAGSLAYTVGQDIYFAPGRYRPETVDGRRLLAHELTHVRQQTSGQAPVAPQHQDAVPRAAPVDAAAQRIIDLATDASRPLADRAVAVVRAIVDRYYAGDATKISAITYRDGEPGLQVTYSGSGATTTGAISVGRYFVENTTQRHFARRVAQVGHEVEHVGQVRGGMVGPSRSDEREFLAFYHEGLFSEPAGAGRIQHSTRVQVIDGALGYYCCFDAELQQTHRPKRDELIARRAAEVRASGHDDLGDPPTACRRQRD